MENRDDFVKAIAGDKVLVDFWASWCGPCRAQAPVLDELAAKHADLTVVKVNVDEMPDIAGEYGVSAIPTLILFKDGTPIKKAVGLTPLDELEQML